MGGKGRGQARKGIYCCDRKVVIWEFSFFLLLNKTEWALVYRPEPLCLHFAASCMHCTNELDLYTREIPYGKNILFGDSTKIQKCGTWYNSCGQYMSFTECLENIFSKIIECLQLIHRANGTHRFHIENLQGKFLKSSFSSVS